MIDEQRFEALEQAVRGLLRRTYELEQRFASLEQALRPTAEQVARPPTHVVFEPIAAKAADHPDISPADMPSPTVLAEARSEQAAPGTSSTVGRRATERPAIETKVGLTIVNRIGVITLVLGVAFFFKWAVDSNWIGPVGRVFLGLVAGFAALGGADYLWRKAQETFAQGVTGAGLAILYLSGYAAFGFYHLIPQFAAFAFLLSATALGFALSLRYSARAIAALGLFGGYLTPLLLSTGEDHPLFLLSYLLVLGAAAMGLVRRKEWHVLEALAFVPTTLIFFAWFSHRAEQHRGSLVATAGALAYYALFTYAGSRPVALAAQIAGAAELLVIWEDAPASFFTFELLVALAGVAYSAFKKLPAALAVAFASFWACFAIFHASAETAGTGAQVAGISIGFLLFFAAQLIGPFALNAELAYSQQSLTTLAANGTVYFGFAYLLLRIHHHNWLGLLAISIAGIYLAVAALLRKRMPVRETLDSKPLLVALGMAIAFVALAIPIQLTGFRITIGWAIQAAGITWIGMKLRSWRALLFGAALLLLVAIRLLLWDTLAYGARTDTVPLVVNARFATFAIAAACTFLAARWAVPLARRLALAQYVGGHLALLTGLTLEVAAWAKRGTPPENLLSVETVSISILFACYALLCVGIGVASRTAVNRICGLALLAAVIVKLYLFDVWQLNRVYRITAFVALGLLLMSTSFLYSRFRQVIEALLKSDETAA